MEQTKLIAMIENNPNAIIYMDNPTDEIKLLAIKKNGLLLKYIHQPTRQMEELALSNNARAIEFIDNPTEDMMRKAIDAGWINLKYLKNPPDPLIKLAIQQAGWAIQYVTNPSEELQLLAVSQNYDSIKFIKDPYESVQEAAVNLSYEALRYISAPTHHAELLGIKQDERAIRLINHLTKDKILEFLAVNFLIIHYVPTEISPDELAQVASQTLSNENVEEKYVRDFLKSNIDKNSNLLPMDKMMFIYKYGSKKAKKIAVDEKLKLK